MVLRQGSRAFAAPLLVTSVWRWGICSHRYVAAVDCESLGWIVGLRTPAKYHHSVFDACSSRENGHCEAGFVAVTCCCKLQISVAHPAVCVLLR